MKDFLMPVLALVCGIMSLYVDSKDKGKRWLLLAGLVITATVTVGFNILDTREKSADVLDAKNQTEKMLKILQNVTENTNQIPNVIRMLTSNGYTPENAAKATAAQIQQSVAANRAYSGMVAETLSRPRPASRGPQA